MFAKPFHIKSQTVLKGSDRKRIRTQILSQFPLFSIDALNELLPQKSDVQQAKVSLHNGEPAIILLCAKQPVFFLLGSTYYPTVYTLWNYPDSVNTFSTWQPVISKLYGGADLMLPGVVLQTELTAETLSHVTAGSAAAVAAVGNRAALAVGETCMSGDDMYKAGMRGKGVAIKHFYGDQLWSMGSKVSPPHIAEPQLTHSRADELEQDVDKLQIDDHTEVSVENPKEETVAMGSAEGTGQGPAEDQGEHSGAVAMTEHIQPAEDTVEHPTCMDTNLSTDVNRWPVFTELTEDEQLYKCFLYALKKKIKASQLPMLTSAFFRDCIQSCCPPGSILDIKKTTYKKLMPFLGEMQKQGFLEVKETAKGVHSLIRININHDEVQSFRPWKLPVQEESKPDATQEYVYEPPLITELLSVNAQTLPLFCQLGMSKGDTLSLSDMRSLVTDYVKNKSLQHQQNKQLVQLDEALTKAVVSKKDGYVEHLKWNILFERLSNALGLVYQISYPNGSVVVKKGKPPPIQVKLETRTGNKKVTLINNLDKFGIDVKVIAKELRSTKACNTSIQESQIGQQVLAQGNHAGFVHKLLKDKYRIPIKYLDVPT